MKITEDFLNNYALEVISEIMETCYDIINKDNEFAERGYLLMTLGEINGIIDVVSEMKKAINE